MWENMPINDKMSLTIGTVGDMMQKAGYYPAYKGKWHITKDTESLAEYGFLDWTEGDMYGSVLEGYHEDGMIADQLFSVLMGDDVEPRREFIIEHAHEVINLDV